MLYSFQVSIGIIEYYPSKWKECVEKWNFVWLFIFKIRSFDLYLPGCPILHKLEPQLWIFPFLYMYLFSLEKFLIFEKAAHKNVYCLPCKFPVLYVGLIFIYIMSYGYTLLLGLVVYTDMDWKIDSWLTIAFWHSM